MYEYIPEELKQFPNWVCWKAERRGEKLTKLPVNPKTGGKAMSNNPETWSDFDTAARAAEKYSGIGFMFSSSPYFGVDIDSAEDDIAAFREGGGGLITELVSTLKSYTELSQSGKGIHIICRGRLPEGGRRRGNIEMYEDGRFFVMTGNILAEYTEIADCTEPIKLLHEKYLGAAKKPENVTSMLQTMSAADVLEAARRSKNGAKFTALYSGDTGGYPSQSEADLALCNLLAFWTGRDAALMDELFRGSGLFREDKWDRKQSGTTYGAITIHKAIESCTEVYQPRKSRQKEDCRISFGTGESSRFYTLDDMGNSKRFIDLFGEDLRYSYVAKKWLYWDGQRWRTDEDGAVERMADSSVESMGKELAQYERGGDDELVKAFRKHIKSSRSNKSKANMLAEARHSLPIMPGQLDNHPFAFNTPDGILSLKTGELVPHDRKYLITKMSGAQIAENAACPLWEKFLGEIFAGDTELIRYVQKAVGYSMTASVSEQCMFILLGDGRNGKSTFLEVIRAVMGDYCANIQAETIMLKNGFGSGINSDIARLNKVRLVTSAEPNEGVRLNEGLIKQLTGGDPVTARRLFENEFEFHPEFKLWLAANHKPLIRGTDTGIWRRIHIIPFSVRIPERSADKQLPAKLKKEYPAILRWALDGCMLWQSEGLKMPRAVYASVKDYRREMDVVSSFLEDACAVRDGLYVKASQLYAAYCAWCADNNEYCMSNTKFAAEIGKKFNKVKRAEGLFYLGITLA